MDSQMAVNIASSLRERGLRVTSQRRVILAAFGQKSIHLTAEEVYDRARADLPELARATVYNTLTELVRVGLLQVVESRGALRYDSNLDREHHHFRCLVCGNLYDVHPDGGTKLGVSEAGFVVERTQILLEGRCPNCQMQTTQA
jgi:Fur family transcriptional regulator, stress-responsive regulator